ncbi:MAG: hypothetical protein NW201_01260 [Gemmatimonadales bacterium]|nr:hypothetical protein [Gemmatimonadales bacterium]
MTRVPGGDDVLMMEESEDASQTDMWQGATADRSVAHEVLDAGGRSAMEHVARLTVAVREGVRLVTVIPLEGPARERLERERQATVGAMQAAGLARDKRES